MILTFLTPKGTPFGDAASFQPSCTYSLSV